MMTNNNITTVKANINNEIAKDKYIKRLHDLEELSDRGYSLYYNEKDKDKKANYKKSLDKVYNKIDQVISIIEKLENGALDVITSKRHIFEIVEKIPVGYEIWNISADVIPGYLPLADVTDYNVNPKTLKAVKCKDYKEIMSAIGGFKAEQESVRHLYKHLKEDAKDLELIAIDLIDMGVKTDEDIKKYVTLSRLRFKELKRIMASK